MKQIQNWSEIKEQGESLVPGGYIIQIKGIEDVADKEYLKISYDIASGKFEGHFAQMWKQFNFWGGTFIRSYKETALSMFKGFINAVEKSNKGFVWNWNEQALKNQYVGIILQEEEYIPQGGAHAGELRTRLVVSKVVEVEKIQKRDFTVPEKKCLSADKKPVQQQTNNGLNLANDDLPF